MQLRRSLAELNVYLLFLKDDFGHRLTLERMCAGNDRAYARPASVTSTASGLLTGLRKIQPLRWTRISI